MNLDKGTDYTSTSYIFVDPYMTASYPAVGHYYNILYEFIVYGLEAAMYILDTDFTIINILAVCSPTGV